MSLHDIEMESSLSEVRVGFNVLENKDIVNKESIVNWFLVLLFLRFLVFIEIGVLGGFSRCLEGVALNSG